MKKIVFITFLILSFSNVKALSLNDITKELKETSTYQMYQNMGSTKVTNDNNKITVINNVKSKDLYVLFSLFIFGILVSFLSKLLYIEYNPTIQSIRVITLKTDTILFSFHPDNSK